MAALYEPMKNPAAVGSSKMDANGPLRSLVYFAYFRRLASSIALSTSFLRESPILTFVNSC